MFRDVDECDTMTNEQGIIATIDTKDEVLENLVCAGQIHAVPVFVIKEAIDKRIGESYFSSQYSMVLMKRNMR